MKKTGYTEPAIGWNDEDNRSGIKTYGVANYAGTAKQAQDHHARPLYLTLPYLSSSPRPRPYVPEPADGWPLLM